METFSNRISDVASEALEYIRSVLNKRGDNPYELIDPTLLEEDELSYEFYDLPRTHRVTRHGAYLEYGIVSVMLEEGRIVCNGIEFDFKEEIKIDIKSFTIYDVCSLADFIKELES